MTSTQKLIVTLYLPIYCSPHHLSCLALALQGNPVEMFAPGYATIGRLLDGDTVARKCGVTVGDCIVAVNGQGFRRFKTDFKDEELENLSKSSDKALIENDHTVINLNTGEAYEALLAKIKAVKAAQDPPLCLGLERYGWDAAINSWPRFLEARDGNVPEAMKMLQDHEQWRTDTFPIDLTRDGVQDVLRLKAVAEIDTEQHSNLPPVVYVNFSKLQSVETVSPDDVCKAFVIFTEMMLGRSKDPRNPKTSQFIDLSGVTISSGFRVDMLKKIYKVFEPNYPETLSKMVMYPVSTMLATTARTLLNFVNEKTQKKFVITNSLAKVCEELGWDQREVEGCGGVTEFMHKHEKAGASLLLE